MLGCPFAALAADEAKVRLPIEAVPRLEFTQTVFRISRWTYSAEFFILTPESRLEANRPGPCPSDVMLNPRGGFAIAYGLLAA
jgi:hypothetical protein